MKSLQIFLFCIFSHLVWSQNNFIQNIKIGIAPTIAWNPSGEYIYTLHKNSYLMEQNENHWSTMLSLVTCFPMDRDQKYNFVINLPLVNYNFNDVTVFNRQTPFGLGFAFMLTDHLGITFLTNLGSIKRVRSYVLEPILDSAGNPVMTMGVDGLDNKYNVYFPLPMPNNYSLSVGGVVPEDVLKPYLKNEFAISFNIGIIIRQ